MKYIPLQDIMWKILKNPLLRDVTIEDAASITYSLIKLLKIPLTMITQTEVKCVEDYKIRLPESLVDVLGVRHIGLNKALNYSANPYHTSAVNKAPSSCHNDYSYIIQNCNIITSFEKGDVEISYKMLAMDDNGYPLIPDNESFIKAVEYDIMMNYMEPLWMMGKVTDKAFNRASQQRDWYVGQASSAFKIVNADHFSMMMNSVNRLLINTQARESFYQGFGDLERIKRY